MSRIQTALLIIAVSLLAATGGFGLQRWLMEPVAPPTETPTTTTMVGALLPDFSFINLAGEPITRDQFSGKPLVINLWATWCGPCREEMPDLDLVATEVRSKGIAMLGVALDQPGKVAEFLKLTPVSYPIAITETTQGMGFARALGNRNGVLPYTVFVDSRGRIREVKVGISDLAEIRAQVAGLLMD